MLTPLLRRRQVPSHANGAIAGSRARRGSPFWPVATYRRRPPSHRQRPRGSGLLRADHEGLASTRLMGGGGVPHTRRVISGLREQTAVLRGGVLARRQAQQHL